MRSSFVPVTNPEVVINLASTFLISELLQCQLELSSQDQASDISEYLPRVLELLKKYPDNVFIVDLAKLYFEKLSL